MRITLCRGQAWGLFKVMAVCSLQGSTSVHVTHRLSLARLSEASRNQQGQAGIWGTVRSLMNSPCMVPWSLVLSPQYTYIGI